MDWDRRTILKTTGAAAGASLLPAGSAGAAAAGPLSYLDDSFDLDGGLQEALVVFRKGADMEGLLSQFDLDLTVEMEAVGITYTKAVPSTLKRVAGLDDVQFVERNRQLEWDNGDAAEAVNIEDRVADRENDGGGVQDTFGTNFTGDGVHVAVIDSGVDAYHPDLQDRIAHNYRFVEPTNADTMWVDAGENADTDDIGHGTHCSGSVAGEGNQDAYNAGMAPDAKLTVYSTGAAISILQAVGAYNHILSELHPDERVHITSNSYGGGGGNDFNPAGAQETATYRAYSGDLANGETAPGILVVSSAGNSGPGTNTLGGAKTAPHVLCVAASHDGQGAEDTIDATYRPTSFSSRGRTAQYSADNPDSEGARWNEFPNGRGGFTAEDRKTALANVEAFHATGFDSQPEVGSGQSLSFTAGPGADATIAADGAKAGEPTYVEFTPTDGAGFVEATISWTPPGQDLDINLREGSKDGTIVGSAASLDNPEQLNTQIDDSKTYFFEIIPFVAVQATGTIDVTEREPPAEEPSGPYGVYRPSVIAPGSAVVSTMGASALKGLEASYGATPADTGVFYSALSGTSMSCPITSGVCAVVVEAFANTYRRYPTPEEMFRIVEGGARPAAERAYTPYNAGAGFVDAQRSVEQLQNGLVPDYEDIDLAPIGDELELLEVLGSRSDDGQVFTAGQTNQVDIEITDLSHDVAALYDVVPENWELVGGDAFVGADEDGTRVLYYDANGDGSPTPITTDDVAGDSSVTMTYFVEAPAGSGSHEFGPARVVTSETEDADTDFGEDAAVQVPGTASTEYVAGASQNDLPL